MIVFRLSTSSYSAQHFINTPDKGYYFYGQPSSIMSTSPGWQSYSESMQSQTLCEDPNEWTPLQIACLEGNTVLVTSLLQAGEDPNSPATGWYGKTALQAA